MKHYVLIALAFPMMFIGGCILSSTQCKGNLQIMDRPADNSGHYVVVSFWEFPDVNDEKGHLEILNVIPMNGTPQTLEFPARAYWVIWTPALGTQHIKPNPGVIVFSNNGPPTGNIGGTEKQSACCCSPPKSEYDFFISLEQPKPEGSDIPYLDLCSLGDFRNNFLAKKNEILKKMDESGKFSKEDKSMVLKGFKQIKTQPNK